MSNSVHEVLFSLCGSPISLKELSEMHVLAKSEVEEVLEELHDTNFVKKLNDEYVATLPVFTDKLMRNVSSKTKRIALEMSEAAEKFIDDMILKWERSKSPLEWSSVAHLLVGVFGLDHLFLRAVKGLERKNDVWEYRSRGQRFVPAFFLERGKNFTVFGANTYTKFKMLQLHGTLFKREGTLMEILSNKDAMSLLARIKSNKQKIQGKREVMESLALYNWLKKDNGTYRLSIPVVHMKEIQNMIPLMADLSISAAETMFKHYDYILQMFKDTSFASYLDGPGDYIDYIYHVLMYQTIEHLMNKKRLPAIPKPTPWNIGVFLLRGNTLKMLRVTIKMNQTVEERVGAKTEWGTIDVPRIISLISRITDIL